MYRKCPGCSKIYYSAAKEQDWDCPNCGETITKEDEHEQPKVPKTS